MRIERKWSPLVGVLSFALLSCRNEESDRESAARPEPVSVSSSSAPGPSDLLDSMDPRTPVPLLPMMANHQKQNMRDHLLAVQEIAAALASRDFDAVRASTARIGFSQRMGQMCEHMGAAAPGFSELALKFHHTADTIARAAEEKSSEGVLKALGATLSLCTGCHQQYKQRVVSETTWATLSAQSARQSGPGH